MFNVQVWLLLIFLVSDGGVTSQRLVFRSQEDCEHAMADVRDQTTISSTFRYDIMCVNAASP